MASLGYQNPTLFDIATATDPSGRIGEVVEILNQTNSIVTDMAWTQGNLDTGHRHMVRTGIPTPVFTKIYGSIFPDKATQVSIDDQCGMLEAAMELDARLMDLNENVGGFLLQQSRAFLEGFTQKLASSLFFANQGTQPESFNGLSIRFSSLSADNARNIIAGGGAGTDNGSIWLVNHRPDVITGIVPKGTTAGLKMKDVGEETKTLADGSFYRVRRIFWSWYVGIAVPDWRGIARICNIDKSDLSPTVATGAKLANLMFQALDVIPEQSQGNPVWYMSRSMRAMLGQQAVNGTSQSTLAWMDVGGKRVDTWLGIPIRQVDILNADEALVS